MKTSVFNLKTSKQNQEKPLYTPRFEPTTSARVAGILPFKQYNAQQFTDIVIYLNLTLTLIQLLIL